MSTIPQSISGLQLWLDGNDPAGTGTQPANGSTVSTWVDKSGNGYNATAAPSRTAGTYSTSFKAVNFPTSTTGYITNYSASPTNETMFVVFNNPSPSSTNNIIIGGVSGARSLGAGYTAAGVGTVGNLNTQIAWLASTSPYTSGTTVLTTSQFTSSTNTISLNGGTAASGGAPGFTANRVTYLGVDATNGSYYYVGYAMEIIFYNSVLSTIDRQKVEGYLAWKWGIQSSLPSGHPYKSAAPVILIVPSTPFAIPANTSLLFVNTSSFSKTFTLPAISSNPGRLLIFKDIYGSFSTNNVFLSTTGIDGFENNVCTITLKTNYGAWTFMNDGLTNWHLIDTYKNTLAIKGSTPNVLRIDYAWYGSSYKTAGANVTATVLSIFNSGRTSFVAGNGELGDPQPGTGKSFWIDYYPPSSTVLKQSFFPGESSTVTFANLT